MGVFRKKDRTKKKTAAGKKAAAAAAALVLTAGAAVHQRFTPDELLQSGERHPPTAAFDETAVPEEDVLAELPEERRLSRKDAVRGWFIRLPVWVKAVCLLPLWAVGSLPAALAPALGPLWSALGGLAVQLGVLTGLFCLVYKLLFPDHKVRELFRKKNLRWLFLGAVVLTAADVVLAQVWTGWSAARTVLLLGAGFGVLCLLWKRLCGAFRAPEPETVRTRLKVDRAA